MTSKENEFIDGLMYAVQEMAIVHHQDDYARFLMLGSGYRMDDFLLAQKRTGFKTRYMNKLIRYIFRKKS